MTLKTIKRATSCSEAKDYMLLRDEQKKLITQIRLQKL